MTHFLPSTLAESDAVQHSPPSASASISAASPTHRGGPHSAYDHDRGAARLSPSSDGGGGGQDLTQQQREARSEVRKGRKRTVVVVVDLGRSIERTFTTLFAGDVFGTGTGKLGPGVHVKGRFQRGFVEEEKEELHFPDISHKNLDERFPPKVTQRLAL